MTEQATSLNPECLNPYRVFMQFHSLYDYIQIVLAQSYRCNSRVMISSEYFPYFGRRRLGARYGSRKFTSSGSFLSTVLDDDDDDHTDEDDEIPLLSLEGNRFRHRAGSSRSSSRGNQFSHDPDTEKNEARKHHRALTEYLEYEVQNGDTIQSVSIRHGCSTTELKQANNWFSDQDFYAQKLIRIPSRPHSILSEHFSNAHSTRSSNCSSGTDTEKHKVKDKRTVCLGIQKILDVEKNISSDEFLCKMDFDLACIREKTKLYKDSLDEVVASLNSPQIGPLMVMPKTSSCNGADCGISWWGLLLILFVIGIIVPLCYVIYLKTTAGKESKITPMAYNHTQYHQS